MAHIHAELMAQYAEDAKQYDEPWELWQHDASGTWVDCVSHPSWWSHVQYRRKPRTVKISDFEVPESGVPVGLPVPAAWLATFRPKGMMSSHSVAGVNLEELKRSVPGDSVFKPLYTSP